MQTSDDVMVFNSNLKHLEDKKDDIQCSGYIVDTFTNNYVRYKKWG